MLPAVATKPQSDKSSRLHVVAAYIKNLRWRVLISSGPQYFITTDNPAFIFNAYGLGKDKSELCLPLSTTHLLHGSWQSAGSPLLFTPVRKVSVKEMNRRLASGAERIAFFHEPAPWLSAIVRKESPYLSIIRWT